MRLFAYQRSSRSAALLDSLVQSHGQLSATALEVNDCSELPSALQRMVIKSQHTQQVWSAWNDTKGILLVAAEMPLELSRERGCPALQVGTYAMDGKLRGWQLWVHVAAMRAVNVRPGVGDTSAVSVRPLLPTISTPPAGIDSDERCPVADSLYSREQALPLERLVQLLLRDIRYLPPTAQRLLDPSQLPPVLERVAMQAQRCLQTWFAWTEGPRTWFVVTEIATVAIGHRKENAVRVFFNDDEGRFVSWSAWALHSGGWMLWER